MVLIFESCAFGQAAAFTLHDFYGTGQCAIYGRPPRAQTRFLVRKHRAPLTFEL